VKRAKSPYHHGDLRNALIEQAVKLVEELGAESFSLREAARRVGVSANAAYRHFADKSDLLAAVAQVGFGRLERSMLKAMSAVAAQPTPAAAAVERLKSAGRGYLQFAVDHPEMLRVMFGDSAFTSLEDGVAPDPDPYAILKRALDDLVAEGVLPAERRPGAELKAWSVVQGFTSLVMQGVGGFHRKAARTEAFEAVLDFAVIGLCGRLDYELEPGPTVSSAKA
jgi:AcrR family transcriptional regulator